jgi:uncharacterized protein (DUF4213/DUF364 family)
VQNQSPIIEQILASISTDAPVRSILVGAHWTVVCSRGCGMASTITGDKPHGEARVRQVGQLHTQSARQLAELARSDTPLEASIGVAAINSLLEVDLSQAVELNAASVLCERGAGKKVALVGHFPFIPKLREAASALWVIEQQPSQGEHPPEDAVDLLPQAEVVALTASALINQTMEFLLGLCNRDALVMVLGPSTPLTTVWFERGVEILSGSVVIDENAAIRTIGQGATFQQVQGVKRVTLQKAPSLPAF